MNLTITSCDIVYFSFDIKCGSILTLRLPSYTVDKTPINCATIQNGNRGREVISGPYTMLLISTFLPFEFGDFIKLNPDLTHAINTY